jgi:hypothetical protein
MEYLETIGEALLSNIPGILAWSIGIAVAVVLLRRGGCRAEKLFLAGVCLMFFAALAGPLLQGLGRWVISESESFGARATTYGLILLPVSVFYLAGLVCLVWGFWLRFRPGKGEGS